MKLDQGLSYLSLEALIYLLRKAELVTGAYVQPLHFACASALLVNILYALAYRAHCLYLILIGRIVLGLSFAYFMYCKRFCSDTCIVGVCRWTTLASWLVVGQNVGFIPSVLCRCAGAATCLPSTLRAVPWPLLTYVYTAAALGLTLCVAAHTSAADCLLSPSPPVLCSRRCTGCTLCLPCSRAMVQTHPWCAPSLLPSHPVTNDPPHHLPRGMATYGCCTICSSSPTPLPYVCSCPSTTTNTPCCTRPHTHTHPCPCAAAVAQ